MPCLLVDINPFSSLKFAEPAIVYGLLGTLPLLIFFFLLQILPFDALRRIRSLLVEVLVSRLITLHWADLFVLAAIAGISEEILFRGVLQPWVERIWGLNVGLWGSSLIFGLVHAITPLYALLAFLVGIYLGLSMDIGGERNLLTPIVIHGLYDFIAFLLIIRQARSSAYS